MHKNVHICKVATTLGKFLWLFVARFLCDTSELHSNLVFICVTAPLQRSYSMRHNHRFMRLSLWPPSRVCAQNITAQIVYRSTVAVACGLLALGLLPLP